MIVWGGIDESGYSNSGGRYNPTADNWTATSTTNVPGARFFHTAVWTGSEMIVWGGSGDTISSFLIPEADTILAQTVGRLQAPPMRPLHEMLTPLFGLEHK